MKRGPQDNWGANEMLRMFLVLSRLHFSRHGWSSLLLSHVPAVVPSGSL